MSRRTDPAAPRLSVAPSGIVLSALYFRIDVFLVQLWSGTEAVALYNAVFRLVEALRLFPAAGEYFKLAAERMPQLTAAHGQWGLILMRLGDEDQARKVLSSFHSVLLEMVTQGVLATDPFARVTIQQSRYQERVQIPSVVEVRAILKAADELACDEARANLLEQHFAVCRFET